MSPPLLLENIFVCLGKYDKLVVANSPREVMKQCVPRKLSSLWCWWWAWPPGWALFSLYSEVKELRSIRQMPAAPAPAQQGQEYATIYLVKAEPTEFHLV